MGARGCTHKHERMRGNSQERVHVDAEGRAHEDHQNEPTRRSPRGRLTRRSPRARAHQYEIITYWNEPARMSSRVHKNEVTKKGIEPKVKRAREGTRLTTGKLMGIAACEPERTRMDPTMSTTRGPWLRLLGLLQGRARGNGGQGKQVR